MISPKIKLKGAKVFINKLNRDVNTLQDKLNEFVILETKRTFSKSQKSVPKDTKALLGSGEELYPKRGNVVIGTVTYGDDTKSSGNVHYAAYQEFGTGFGFVPLSEELEGINNYASNFRVINDKVITTKRQPYLFRFALLSKRNLERKSNTLAKNL